MNASSPRRIDGFLRTGYLIHDVSRLRRLFYDQQSRHLGITRAQWWVLFNLSRHAGEPLSQNELAQMIELGSAAVGELLQRLEKSGFVERISDPRDRRVKRIVIAARGREVLDHMKLVARENNGAIMAGISPAEQMALNDLLARMKQNLVALQADSVEEGDGEGVIPDPDSIPSTLMEMRDGPRQETQQAAYVE
ncbi:MAG: MarR family winged helix-turn-helix transcriptional regulator [Panacagrimonas sp.]